MLISSELASFAQQPIECALDVIAGLGLKHVTFGLEAIDDDQANASLTAIARLLQSRGLQLASLNLAELDPVEDRDLRRTTAALHVAHALGARVVVVSAGVALDDVHREQLYDRQRRLGDVAAELGIVIALAVQPGICENSREVARTMRELDHPVVRIHFDTGRYLRFNPSASGEIHLQNISPWLASLQLTDHDGTPGNAELPPLGQGGAVDFARTCEIARALAFRGPCVVDFRPRMKRPPTLDQCRMWMEDSLELLTRGGWLDRD